MVMAAEVITLLLISAIQLKCAMRLVIQNTCRNQSYCYSRYVGWLALTNQSYAGDRGAPTPLRPASVLSFFQGQGPRVHMPATVNSCDAFKPKVCGVRIRANQGLT